MLEMVIAAALMRPAADDRVRDRMIALYDQVCLQAFPDDKAVESAMTGFGAAELTPAQVRTYLRDDPGRGWRVESGGTSFTVTLEAPPFHACAVRVMVDTPFTDLGSYPGIAAAYEQAHGGGFRAMQPMERDLDDIHIYGTGDQKVTGTGGESLFYIVYTPLKKATDAGAPPQSEIRLAHQIAQR